MVKEILINFVVAICIGAVMGLEREIMHQKQNIKDFGGVRTFILISIFGFALGYFSIQILNSLTVFIIGFTCFMLLIVSAYIIVGIKTGRIQATSEITATIVFILCSVIAINFENKFRLATIIITMVVASILALKEKLHKFAKHIKISEVYAAVKMGIISAIVLPFLPNKNYTLLDIPFINNLISSPKTIDFLSQIDAFNPFKIWLMVVFISGLSFIGYILVKSVGLNKGIGITSFLGGLVSSTAVTFSLAQKSKEKKVIKPFAFGIVLTSSIMFLRVIIEILVVNKSLLPFVLIPLLVMTIISLIFAFAISLKKEKKDHKDSKVEFENPFRFKPALKFGLFFLLILILSKVFFILLGDLGIYMVSIVSGLSDVDAIILSISSLAVAGTIGTKTAVLSVILVVSTNTLVKAGIVYFVGRRKLANLILIIFLVVLIMGILTAVLI